MVNFYLGRLGVAQSEIGFPFLFHEVPYVRACLALAEAGAFGDLRLSGWCRAVAADVETAVAVQAGGAGLRHYSLGPQRRRRGSREHMNVALYPKDSVQRHSHGILDWGKCPVWVNRKGVFGGGSPLAMFRSFVAVTYITRVAGGRLGG